MEERVVPIKSFVKHEKDQRWAENKKYARAGQNVSKKETAVFAVRFFEMPRMAIRVL